MPDGTLTVFVGPSGCGKTTSMRMINRMIDPTSGTLTVDGDDVTKVDPVKLRLGHRLRHPERRADAAPAGGRQRRHRAGAARANPAAQRRKAALGVLERVGLDPKLANRYPAQLSGGQQQRVGVARALAADPPILLMDEPFSAVDPVVREELQTEILRLQSELRKTIVFVTHDIDEAIKLGDKVAVFGRGGVLQQYDAPARLLSNPANDFVAGFVGADRGYRGLQFRHATGLPLHDIRSRRRGRASTPCTSAPDEWVLVTKPDGTPYAWINADGVDAAPRAAARCTTAPSPAVRCSGRTARCGRRSTRRCPRRRGSGVAVDDDGQVVGGVRADDVLAALKRQRQRSVAEARGELTCATCSPTSTTPGR